MHLIGCEDVVIDSISIHNAWDVPNNDGIDIDHCRGVRIANCFIESADDCIVIKNTPNFASYGGSAHITVTGCTICVAKHRAENWMKSTPCPARGTSCLPIALCFTATAGFRFRAWTRVTSKTCSLPTSRSKPVFSRTNGGVRRSRFISAIFRARQRPNWGYVRNIRFSNILCRGENGIFLMGWTNSPLENIVLDNVRVEIAKTSDVPGGFYDERPVGVFTNGIFERKLAGIYARDINGLSLQPYRGGLG